jgi:outer membrane receptor protein involved in Fe transport
LGASVDLLDGLTFERERVNPKLGVTWEPRDGTVLRAGAMGTLQRPTPSRQDIQPSLEPTAVGGFNQFFYGSEGEQAERYGVGLDQRFSDNVHAGAQMSWRDLDVPYLFAAPPVFALETRSADVDESEGRAYVYWTPTDRLATTVSYEYDFFETDPEFTPNFVATLETHRVPVGVTYVHPRGPIASLTATFVHQRGRFQDTSAPPFPFVPGEDEFMVVDAAVGYRLPNRWGILSLEIENLFDEDFRFQDVDPENPRIFPERVFLLKGTAAY